MQVFRLEYSSSNFPSYEYFDEKSVELQLRYDALRSEKTRQTSTSKLLILYSYKKYPIFDQLCENEHNEKQCDGSIHIFLGDKTELKQSTHLRKSSFSYKIVIANDIASKEELVKEFADDYSFIVTLEKDLRKAIDNLLERIVLAPLKEISEHCSSELTKYFKGKQEKLSQNGSRYSEIQKNESHTRVRYDQGTDETRNHKRKWKVDATKKLKTKKVKRNDKRLDSPEEKSRNGTGRSGYEDSFESILSAIQALYRMRNIPERHRPKLPEEQFKVPEKVKKEIFDISTSIKRMGYRYSTFIVYAVSMDSEDHVKARYTRIIKTLQENSIYNFDICDCEENVLPLMQVGAEVRNDDSKTATLGCIGKGNDNHQYGLISKHFAEGQRNLYFEGQKFAEILEETNEQRHGSLDISAARMVHSVEETARRFKNKHGSREKASLYDFDERQPGYFGMGQPVYFHGATTKPGVGDITMPSIECGLASPLIQVEDKIGREGKVEDHFARPGDSGAIVCSDIPGNEVVALSMLMGVDTATESCKRRKYLTLPLSKGIQQIHEETGKTLEL